MLFERLRALRKKLADERSLPSYIIFGDNTLRAMARYYPTTVAERKGIPGTGEKKRAEFAATFASAIADYLTTNSRVQFDRIHESQAPSPDLLGSAYNFKSPPKNF